LINIAHENINLHWVTNLNIGIDNWLLSLLGSRCEQHLHTRLGHQCFLQGRYMAMLFAYVKQQCQEVTTRLIAKLQGQFFAQDFMDALGIVYPQCWLQPKLEKKVQCSFGNHQGSPLLA